MKVKTQQVIGCIALVIGGLLASSPVRAAGLQVTPTSINFQPGDQSQQLWLSNSSSLPLQAQVRLFKWTQSTEDDILKASQDFALSPAMVRVAPGEKQLVRIIRRSGAVVANDQVEESFRIFVDELPVPDESGGEPGVQFVFRYSLPLFVNYGLDDDPLRKVVWQYRLIPDGLMLRVKNTGQKHLQIAGLNLVAGDQQLEVHKGLFGYVLANHTREWKIEVENSSAKKIDLIKATVNGENIEHSITAWSDSD